MRRDHGLALIALIALAGCYERGKARPAERDAGVVVAPVDDAPPPQHGHVEPAGPPDPDATITIALGAEPPALDVLAGADAPTQWVLMGDVYEGLVCPGPRLGDPAVPCLADRIDEADAGTRWTFHLREARWHDGEPVRAADVAATFAAIRATGSWLVGELEDLEAVETPSDDTVVLRFREARPDRLASLARIPIVSGRDRIGSGPLRVTGWQRGDRIELARWDGYWGEPAGAARVVYRIVGRDHVLRLLEAGAIDVAVQLPPDDAIRFAGEHRARFGAYRYRMPAFLAAIYNTRRPTLVHPAVRRGLTALLDRPGIAARMLHSRTITGPFPESDPGYDRSVEAIPFSREVAAQAFGTALHPEVELLVPQESSVAAKVADVWASDARGLATITVVTAPFADVLRRVAAGDFDVVLMSMSSGPELDLTSRLASTSPPEEAWPGLADPELDRLLAEARREPDAGKRAALRRALHRRIAELVPMAFIAADVRYGIARSDVGGIAGAREGAPPQAARLWRARAP